MDIVEELKNPGVDPRIERENIQKLKDLNEGSILEGKVTNITNFGVFVNIGAQVDGFVHISQISNKFVKASINEIQTF